MKTSNNEDRIVKKSVLSNKDFVELIQLRKKHVNFICKKYSMQNDDLQLRRDSLLWLRHENIAMCPIFKSATSSWFSVLIELSSNSDKQKIAARRDVQKNAISTVSRIVDKPNAPQWIEYIQSIDDTSHDLTEFIVVRYPFERLVSAYRNKLEVWTAVH